jgi:Double-stranded DNA deaminase toxin A
MLIAEAMPEQFNDIVGLLDELESGIDQVRTRMVGTASPPASTSAATRPAQPSTRRGTVTNQHGNTYPAIASGLVEDLPPRGVPNSGDRTVGIPLIAGVKRDQISSGYHPRWTGEAEKLLLAHGYNPERLKYHVEIKVVTMMIITGQTRVELATNYTPCGAELQRLRPDTCHKVLAKLLPPGYRLTVYGTTQDNQAWQQTYGSDDDERTG